MKGAVVGIDRAGDGDADPEHAAAVDLGVLERGVDQAGDEVHGLPGVVVDVGVGRGLGEHGAAEVGDGDADAVVVELHADGGAGGAVEAEHGRRAALGGRRRVLAVGALDDEAALDEIRDEGRHRRPAQAGATCDVRTAQSPGTAQRVDHP